jgi:hypothetical protein
MVTVEVLIILDDMLGDTGRQSGTQHLQGWRNRVGGITTVREEPTDAEQRARLLAVPLMHSLTACEVSVVATG